MGTGPATYLASTHKIGGLILFSPFLSLQEAAKDMVGSVLGFFVNDRFVNRERIQKVNSPIIIIHGEKDTIIPIRHARELFQLINVNVEKRLYTPEKMDHNEFEYYQDFLEPVQLFLEHFLNEISLSYIDPEAFMVCKEGI